MKLRGAPDLYSGKNIGDEDTYVQRVRQDNMKEMIKAQILENRIAREKYKQLRDEENGQMKYNYSIKNK